MNEREPLVVAYGMGVDSTAMLVGLRERGIRPDLILFADTGSEKPETYAYLPTINAWLRSVGFPEVEVVRYVPQRPRNGFYDSLHTNCLVNETLPSLAFGYGKCSLKWKREPQDKRVRAWEPAREAWAAGLKVVKAIGYDNGPADARRAKDAPETDDEYRFWYPLREWGWDRRECERQIRAAGLPVPMKSACFMCPSSKPEEIDWLMANHPELVETIVEMERRFAPHARLNADGTPKIAGLWRRATKTKPGSMTEYVEKRRLALVEEQSVSSCSGGCF